MASLVTLLLTTAPALKGRPAPVDLPTLNGRPAAECGRLRAQERTLVCADGTLFRWRGVTAFRLADLIADGRDAEAVRYLDWAHRTGFNVVRVLATLCCWFDLPPGAGQKALPKLLALAKERGMSVQIVALAGTAPHERSIDLEAQVRAIGAIAAAHDNAIVEIANEPEHATQDRRLHNFAYVDKLATLVPADVLTIGGSARVDHAVTPPLGDLVTRHLSRLDNVWEMMQRVRGLAHVAEATGRPVLSGEPFGAGEKRVPGTRETDPDLFFTYGALCRVFELSCNFHLEAGLHAALPGPVQQAGAEAFIAGTRAAPTTGASRSATSARRNRPWDGRISAARVRSTRAWPATKDSPWRSASAATSSFNGRATSRRRPFAIGRPSRPGASGESSRNDGVARRAGPRPRDARSRVVGLVPEVPINQKHAGRVGHPGLGSHETVPCCDGAVGCRHRGERR